MTSWLNTILIAVVSSLITFLITLNISQRLNTNKNTKEIQKLSRQLGLNDKKTLRKNITEKFNSISKDIGREENSSLTKQHADIQLLLQKEIDLIERRYVEEENRIRNFSIEQHSMAEKIDDFKLLIESWQRLTEDVNLLNNRINQLQQENNKLKARNKELTNYRQQQHHDNIDLTSKYKNTDINLNLL